MCRSDVEDGEFSQLGMEYMLRMGTRGHFHLHVCNCSPTMRRSDVENGEFLCVPI